MAKERLRGFETDEVPAPVTSEPVQRRPVLFGLDFERTVTADPNLWKCFIVGAVRVGHKVLLITTSRNSQKLQREIDGALGNVKQQLIAILYTGGNPKRQFALLYGHRVDVWIDDIPETIGAETHHEVRDAESTFPKAETLPNSH